MIKLDGLAEFMIAGMIAMVILFSIGIYTVIDWLWIEDVYKSEVRIEPKIKLVIKDNQVDTVYVYRFK